ncbi:hypothetical protein ACIPWF_21890 [Paenarthrobacter sp. NPDC089989]|uniref:hypothetical protein n=1 Tax=unclassified Paenarthrobacter TaxID=2634190 RepID=UPI0037FE201B
MQTFTWADASADKAGTKVAVLLPGSGYPVEGPVLFWVGEMLAALGWHVQAVRWTPEDKPHHDPHLLVAQAAEQAFADSPVASQRLIVAKSLSTLAIPWAEETRTPGVWLTPLLTDERVRNTIIRSAKNDLFIGGSKDELWDGGHRGEPNGTFLEVAGADHSLQVGNDWRASQEAQAMVFEKIEEFILGLGDA